LIYPFDWILKNGVNYHQPSTFTLKLPRAEYKNLIPFNSPEVTRLILVASGTISWDGKGRSLAKDDLTPETLKRCKNEK
jgi:hypothetical protein